MARKTISIINEVKKVLQKGDELSIRQISIKTKSQWRTAEHALEMMNSLGIVKERKGDSTKRDERLFRLK